jgi:hypothetical protein
MPRFFVAAMRLLKQSAHIETRDVRSLGTLRWQKRFRQVLEGEFAGGLSTHAQRVLIARALRPAQEVFLTED